MNGVNFESNEQQSILIASIDPIQFQQALDQQKFIELTKQQTKKPLFVLEENIKSLAQQIEVAKELSITDSIQTLVAEARDAAVSVFVSDDEMSAELSIETAYSGDWPSLEDIQILLEEHNIVRGISIKRISNLLEESKLMAAGSIVKGIVAKGLPARNGKDSRIKLLVPNAVERILSPREITGNRVDMRDLGDISCIEPQTPFAERLAPTQGRNGFTLSNEVVPSIAGVWLTINLGENAQIEPDNNNVVVSTVAGQPIFKDDILSIVDAYESKGVNVGTGNIDYCGSVIVNGDVTEHMEIIASGDVTINGFVESALIKSGGDIIITKGALGTMQNVDCQLIAQGNIYLAHGQGLDIKVDKNLHVAKQLAYSRVKCKGKLIVGQGDKPQGILFASSLECGSMIEAGILGAVSESHLDIDFSYYKKEIQTKIKALTSMIKRLRESNVHHLTKLNRIKGFTIPEALQENVEFLNHEITQESEFLEWLENYLDKLNIRLAEYDKGIVIKANRTLFPGVKTLIDGKEWHGEKEYGKCMLKFVNKAWVKTPLS